MLCCSGNALCCLSTGGEPRHALGVAKWVYCSLFGVVTVVTWLLRTYGEAAFTRNRLFAAVCADATAGGNAAVSTSALCSGQQVVLRFSFATFSFFAAHALALLWCRRESDPRVGLHTGGWLWKALLWAGALVGFLFVPPGAIFYYANAARFGAGLFLVFVMVETVAATYDANAALVAADAWWSWALLVAGAALGFGGGLALVALCYHYYATSPGCSLNLFFITWSLVMGLAMVAVLFVPGRLEVAGLLTSGAVFAYASYLLLSALSSEPLNDCVRDTGARQQWITIVGVFLGLAAVVYSTLTLGTSHIFGGGDEDKGELPYRPDVFHLIFALAAMYMAMLLTNWQLSPDPGDMWRIDRGWISTWVKMGSKWFAEALYIWTVVAPAVCRHRDFT
ncbi:SERINC3 [Scenedesmus sp. PABB004]|nr:SERINC3 [Scenedesmus sp. PABB004]